MIFPRFASASHGIFFTVDWFIRLLVFPVIGQRDNFGFGLTTIDWKLLHNTAHYEWKSLRVKTLITLLAGLCTAFADELRLKKR